MKGREGHGDIGKQWLKDTEFLFEVMTCAKIDSGDGHISVAIIKTIKSHILYR